MMLVPPEYAGSLAPATDQATYRPAMPIFGHLEGSDVGLAEISSQGAARRELSESVRFRLELPLRIRLRGHVQRRPSAATIAQLRCLDVCRSGLLADSQPNH